MRDAIFAMAVGAATYFLFPHVVDMVARQTETKFLDKQKIYECTIDGKRLGDGGVIIRSNYDVPVPKQGNALINMVTSDWWQRHVDVQWAAVTIFANGGTAHTDIAHLKISPNSNINFMEVRDRKEVMSVHDLERLTAFCGVNRPAANSQTSRYTAMKRSITPG